MKKSYCMKVVACFIIFCFTFPALPAFAVSKKCKQIIIKSEYDVRSEFITFFKLKKSRPVEDHRLHAGKIKYPLILEECGVRQFYVYRQPGKAFLVKKSKFKCIKFDVASSRKMTAGLPGSGNANEDCD